MLLVQLELSHGNYYSWYISPNCTDNILSSVLQTILLSMVFVLQPLFKDSMVITCLGQMYVIYNFYFLVGADLDTISQLGEVYVANSESACWSHCGNSLLQGGFQNFAYQNNNNLCFCKTTTLISAASALVAVSGFVVSIAGVCPNNTLSDCKPSFTARVKSY